MVINITPVKVYGTMTPAEELVISNYVERRALKGVRIDVLSISVQRRYLRLRVLRNGEIRYVTFVPRSVNWSDWNGPWHWVLKYVDKVHGYSH